MATGLSNQCTKQVGEHLVAAELARQGFLVATFAGNVPGFDIVAVKDSKRALIQVKAKTPHVHNWILNPRKFMTIEFDEKEGVQYYRGKEKPTHADIVYVFVELGRNRREDKLYVLRWEALQEVVEKAYFRGNQVLKRKEKPGSFHFAVGPKELGDYSVDPEAGLPV